eukprot:scaffold115390_cov56-Phaeocystis_antarctica.AAC.4
MSKPSLVWPASAEAHAVPPQPGAPRLAEAWGGLRSDPALAAAEGQLAEACATLGSTQALLLDYPLTQAHPTVPFNTGLARQPLSGDTPAAADG